MKRFLAIVLMVLMITNIVTVALADTAVPYASRVFQSTTTSIKISGGTVEATAFAESVYTASQLGIKSMNIQVWNGSTWSTVKSRSASYKYNTKMYSTSIECAAVSGKKYRAVATYYGIVNGVSQSLSVPSATKTAP